jgi:hypothetical protein
VKNFTNPLRGKLSDDNFPPLREHFNLQNLHMMNTKWRVFAVLAALGVLHTVTAADITGKITLQGNPPPEKELPLDPACGKLHDNKPTTRFYVVSAGKGLADVFVYLKDAKAGGALGKPGLLDQKGCEYTPYVSGLQTKQKLLVRNSDPVLHNIHPTPAVAGNKEVNRAQLPKSPDLEFTFDNPEIMLRFKCDVHPWMFSYVSVVDHPYFAVTDKDGNFKIENVPAGEYTLEAVHRKAGTQSKKVKAGDKADFTFEVK